MIAINELRIGNWIFFNPTLIHQNMQAEPMPVHVSSIHADKVGAIQHNLEYRVEPFEDDVMVKKIPGFAPEELEPIPLTEEWLQNFGFQRSDNDWISEEKNNQQIKIPDDLTFNHKPSSSIQIKTVHQLQNLYFALTAQELDLKE